MKAIDLKDYPEFEIILGSLNDEGTVVTRNGHAVALVTPLDDDELEWRALESDPAFKESLLRADRHISEGKFSTHEQVKKELGIE